VPAKLLRLELKEGADVVVCVAKERAFEIARNDARAKGFVDANILIYAFSRIFERRSPNFC
jgi:hypothetical protein